MDDERRKRPRITVLPADLRVVDIQPYEVTSIVDMSRGGMKIEVNGSAPGVGALLDIHLQLPAGRVMVQLFNRSGRIRRMCSSDAN